MGLPKTFLKLSVSEKQKVYRDIQNAINDTTDFNLPIIHQQLIDDFSKVTLYNNLVVEIYSKGGEADIKNILDSYELAMSNESE
jgi:hypothetical protein